MKKLNRVPAKSGTKNSQKTGKKIEKNFLKTMGKGANADPRFEKRRSQLNKGRHQSRVRAPKGQKIYKKHTNR